MSDSGDADIAGELEELQLAVTHKDERIQSLNEQLERLKAECEELRTDNRKLKAQRASIVAVGGTMDGETEDYNDMEMESKISFFLHKTFGLRVPRTVFVREDLQMLAMNALFSLHHLDHAVDLQDGSLSLSPSFEEMHEPQTIFHWKAVRVAFHYALLFLKQLGEECMEPRTRAVVAQNFPLQWLLGVFPVKFPSTEAPSNPAALPWLPFHCFLAANPLSLESEGDVETYLNDLELLHEVFHDVAITEDVKPLTIAVSKRVPCLAVVDLMVRSHPESVVVHDEDGSIPVMHACSNNDDIQVIHYLLHGDSSPPPSSSPKAQQQALPHLVRQQLEHADCFGCRAIHYAAFSGRCEIVEYLLSQDPQLVRCQESNGALPLHDAVQNRRGHDEQFRMAQLLIERWAQAAQQRDESGAFPLHLAAKCSDLAVFRIVYSAFPQAIFAADYEGLLPLHYFAERVGDKTPYMDVQAFILEKNPKSTVYNDTQLFAQHSDKNNSNGASKGGILTWFRGGNSNNNSNAAAAKPAVPPPKSPSGSRKSTVNKMQHRRGSVTTSSSSLSTTTPKKR